MDIIKIKKVLILLLAIICFSSSLSVSAQSNEYNTQHFEKIKVDCIFSVGKACRPCYYLQNYNLRFQSSPLDWMTSYSLSTTAHLFKTKFEDFFEEIKEIPRKFRFGCKFVKDTKNGVVSIHHFRRDSPLDEEHKNFRETMLRRANKVDKILNNSSSIGLISDRDTESLEELVDFIKKFSEIYPNKKIYLINIKDTQIDGIDRSVLFEEDNLKIIQFSFLDKPPSNDEKKTPGWIGNPYAWEAVINCLELNKEKPNI